MMKFKYGNILYGQTKSEKGLGNKGGIDCVGRWHEQEKSEIQMARSCLLARGGHAKSLYQIHYARLWHGHA